MLPCTDVYTLCISILTFVHVTYLICYNGYFDVVQCMCDMLTIDWMHITGTIRCTSISGPLS